MHMTVSDTVVLSDDAYRTSDIMNDVTNSYHPAPNDTFFKLVRLHIPSHFFTIMCLYLGILFEVTWRMEHARFNKQRL